MAAPNSTVEAMRRSTRVRADIPVRVRSLDPANPFDLLTATIIINAQGCGLQATAELPLHVPVQLDIDDRTATGKVLNSALIDAERNIYLTGVALDQPGNFWGLESPPPDWAEIAANAAAQTGAMPKPHPFARKKAAASAGVHPFARPAPQSSKSSTRLPVAPSSPPAQPDAAQLRAQASAEWERWRAEATAALAALRDDLQRKMGADAAAWRQETERASAAISRLLASADEQARAAAEQLKRTESAASSVQSDIAAALETIRTTAPAAQKREEDLSRLRDEVRQLTANAPAVVEDIVRQRAGQAMDAVTADVQQKLSGVLSGGLQQLQHRIEEMANAAAADVRGRLVSDFDTRQAALLESANSLKAELERREASFRAASEQFSAELARRAEEAVAQMRQQVDNASAAPSESAAARSRENLDAAVQRLEAELSARQAAITGEIQQLTAAARASLQQEAERSTTAVRQRIDEMATAAASHAGTGLVSQLDSARVEISAELARRAEESMAALRTEVERASAASLQKLTAGLEAGQQSLDAHLQQQAWEYDAQAEAGAARLQEKLEVALQRLETDIAERQAALASTIAADVGKITDESRSALEAERERQSQAFRENIDAEFRRREEQFDARQKDLDGRFSALQEQHQAVAKELADLQQTRSYIESLVTALPDTLRAQAQQHASEAWESFRSRTEQHVAETLHASSEREQGILRDQVTGFGRQLREEMAEHAQQTASDLNLKLSALLEERSDQAIAALQEKSAELTARQAAQASGAADRLQALQAGAEEKSQAMQKQIEAAQRWLQEQSAQFEKTVHDAFLSAGGEIRGRVHSAVDTAEEMIRQKSKDALAEMEVAAKQQAQSVAHAAEEAQDSAGKALQARLIETLDMFRNDASRLAESALSRWQTAMDETMRSVPGMLRSKLDANPEAPPVEETGATAKS